MNARHPRGSRFTRRAALKTGMGTVLGIAALAPSRGKRTAGFAATAGAQAAENLFRELDAKIADGMARYHIRRDRSDVLSRGVRARRGRRWPPGSYRANFVRDDGRVAWLSYGGRMYGREE
jgi:hypothetical protein